MSFLRDLLYGFRSLRHRPGFAAAVVLTLALGIGVNTAVYTLLRSVFQDPWPVLDPKSLFTIYRTEQAPNGSYTGYNGFSYDDYVDFSRRGTAWKQLGAFQWWAASLASGTAQPVRGTAVYVSTNYFDILAIRPREGRFFSPAEGDKTNPSFVAVLSAGTADRFFGPGADAKGKTISINGRTFEVIGVAPAGFTGTDLGTAADVWLPLPHLQQVMAFKSSFGQRSSSLLRVFGRRELGSTLQTIERDAARISEQLEKEYPVPLKGYGTAVGRLTELAINPRSREAILGYGANLRGAMGVLLLVACINVANLLLVRGTEHGRELAVVQALGASRRRVIQRLFGEFALLFAAAGLLGLPLGMLALRLIWLLRPQEVTSAVMPSGLDGSTLLVCAGVTLVTVILCGLVPIWLSSRPSALAALRTSQRASPSGAVPRKLRNTLLVLQLAIALTALLGAALFLRSLASSRDTVLGFDKDRIAVATLAPGESGHKPEEVPPLFDEILRAVRGLPGVEAAAFAENRLLRGAVSRHSYYRPGEVDPIELQGTSHRTNIVSPDFFKTAGTPLIAGRDFSPLDCPDCPRVLIVNRTFADVAWPGENVVGRHVSLDEDGKGPVYEIIGVAENARYREIVESPQIFVYMAMSQHPVNAATLHVRTRAQPREIIQPMMETVRTIDPALPAGDVAPLARFVDLALWKETSSAFLFSTLALLAVALSAIGVYSRMAYAVHQRRQEISVRLALGAERRSIFWMVLGETTFIAALAAGLGAVVSWFLIRPRLLPVIHPGCELQPLDWVVAIALLMLAAVAGSFLPAHRAAGLAPAAPLREE